jgi:predicted nucleic acid-binding protein
VTEVVLDASVVLKWFGGQNEEHEAQALAIRAAYQLGRLLILAPHLLALEIINVAGRRWQWTADQLNQLAADLRILGFEWKEADLTSISNWTTLGLTAYDASYVALAQDMGVQLVTDDQRILQLASGVSASLETWREV